MMALSISPMGWSQIIPMTFWNDHLVVQIIGSASNSASTNTVTYTLGQSIPAGSFLVVIYAGRSVTTWSVADSQSNVYHQAVAENNATNAASTAIFYTTISSALGPGGTITATVGTANVDARTISILKFNRVATLDQTGVSRGSTATLTVTTTGSVAYMREIIVGASATGATTADIFTSDPTFTQIYNYSNSASSGIVSYKIGGSLSGTQTFSPSQNGVGNVGNIIATFY
jgi:hypothetical protein